MRKTKAVIMAVFVLVFAFSLFPMNVFALDTDVGFDENPGLTLSLTGVQGNYYSGNLGYGDFHGLFFDSGATVTFSLGTQLYNMGEEARFAEAGAVLSIADIDGSYFYLGEPLMSTYVALVGPNSAAMYTPGDRALAGTIPVAGAAPDVAVGGGGESGVPAELASAFFVGVWPLDPGAYDPALDGNGIPDGATVYGLFDAAYAMLARPSSVTGYAEVGSIADLSIGTFTVFDASSGFGYVILMSDPSATPAPPPPSTLPAAGGGDAITVYFTVSFNGTLQVASQPVQVTTYTVEEVIKVAHDKWYPGGVAAGFASGIDQSFGMYLINRAWGVDTVPFVIRNNAPLGVNENAAWISADTAPVEHGDSISLTVMEAQGAYPVVSMILEPDGNVSVLQWAFDTATFQYASSSFAAIEIIDPLDGTRLGETNQMGKAFGMRTPASGVAAVKGLGAVRVRDDVAEFTPPNDERLNKYFRDYGIFAGQEGRNILTTIIIALVLCVAMSIIAFTTQKKEIRNKGVKTFDDSALSTKK